MIVQIIRTLSFVILGNCLILMYRNWLVYQIRRRVNEECHNYALASMMTGQPLTMHEAWTPYFNLGSHYQMVFDISKWTYRQFCPEMPEIDEKTPESNEK